MNESIRKNLSDGCGWVGVLGLPECAVDLLFVGGHRVDVVKGLLHTDCIPLVDCHLGGVCLLVRFLVWYPLHIQINVRGESMDFNQLCSCLKQYGASWMIFKELSENDNSKNQV